MLLFYLSLLESEADKAKFERTYYEYRKIMKNMAMEMLEDEFAAEDAVHEAFVRLTRYLNGVDESDETKATAFILIIVRSVCLDMLKKEKRALITFCYRRSWFLLV